MGLFGQLLQSCGRTCRLNPRQTDCANIITGRHDMLRISISALGRQCRACAANAKDRTKWAMGLGSSIAALNRA